MSKGSPIVALRLNKELLDRVKRQIDKSNLTRREEPYTFTSWILHAVQEKLSKLERGNRPRKMEAK